jgi:hypothetical protein
MAGVSKIPKVLKPIDKVSLGEITSRRAVTRANEICETLRTTASRLAQPSASGNWTAQRARAVSAICIPFPFILMA